MVSACIGVLGEKQRTRVILTGKTQPGAKVYLGAKVIPVITQKEKPDFLKLLDLCYEMRKAKSSPTP